MTLSPHLGGHEQPGTDTQVDTCRLGAMAAVDALSV
jgi:hypothetical protein